jgi:hypothetical protein
MRRQQLPVYNFTPLKLGEHHQLVHPSGKMIFWKRQILRAVFFEKIRSADDWLALNFCPRSGIYC